MRIEFEVIPYGEEIEQAYARLFPDPSDEKAPAQLRWRFRDGPHGPGFFAVARNGPTIVGMIGLIATRLRAGEETVSAMQAVDTVVDPAYRGRGLFVGMGNAAQESSGIHHGQILWGFPNENAAPGWFGRLGWENFGTVPFMIRPLRTGYLLGKVAPALRRIDFPLVWPRGATPPTEIQRFDDDADELWREFSAQEDCAVDRDAAWLNWRLMDKPDAPYRSVGYHDDQGRLRAFVSTCILPKHGTRICYIMEAMSTPHRLAQLSELLRHELARAAQQGAEIALSWCPRGALNRKAFARAGFLPFPDRLRPIAIHFGSRTLSSTAQPFCADRDWYLSYLDSDTV